jgi:hypothetical protein
MEHVKDNELAIVPEHDFPESSNPVESHVPAKLDQTDPDPGRYYTRLSRAELRKTARNELQPVAVFTIRRERCGNSTLDQPVDPTSVDLDNIHYDITVISMTSVTVHPVT